MAEASSSSGSRENPMSRRKAAGLSWENLPSVLDDVLGAEGHGPSSSHTIAPQRIALEAYHDLGDEPTLIVIELYNSFAATADGHGTEIALIAGALGLGLTDSRMPRARELAAERGVRVVVGYRVDPNEHPNTVVINLAGADRVVRIKAVSTGGGRYDVVKRSITLPQAQAK